MWKHPLLQLLLTVPHVLSLKPVLHVFLGIEMVSTERSKVILACSNSGQVYLIVFVLMFWFRDVWEFSWLSVFTVPPMILSRLRWEPA